MVPSIYGENMFDEFFDNNGFFGSHSPLFGKNSKNLMKTDIRETDDAKAYRFAVELPGFKKDEISLDIKDGYLTIAAQKPRRDVDETRTNRTRRAAFCVRSAMQALARAASTSAMSSRRMSRRSMKTAF